MPEAILLKDVEELGEQGKVVDVSKGYLRNYLIPRKLAQPATKGAIETIRQRQAAAEKAARDAVEKAQENVNLLNRTVLTIPQQAGADGRLFGSVTAQDIATAIREARGLKIDKRNVHLPEPIKNVGTYMVVVDDVHDDHVGTDVLDRLRQVHVAFVDLQPARFLDRRSDVLRGDRSEQATVGAGLLGDRQHGAVEQGDVLLGFLDRVARGALGGLLALADRLDRPLGGRLGELARHQEVA